MTTPTSVSTAGTGSSVPFMTGVSPARGACAEQQERFDLKGCWDPDLWLYRERTLALLRRYMRLSVEVGRLPSLLGREFFRTRITAYRVTTFEDSVIFVHDVERALEQLDGFEKKLIATIVLQDYTRDEAAGRLNCARSTILRRFPEAVDRLSEIFLKGGLLEQLPQPNWRAEKACQEGEIGEFPASGCEDSE